MALPSSFEFLEYAPRRFDGGPEVEWITWLEDQHHAVQVATQRNRALEDVMMVEQERLGSIHQQHHYASRPTSVESYAHMDDPTFVGNRSFINTVVAPVFNIGLAVCGLFVSVILFNILFRGLPTHRKQYEHHNRQVYEQSMTVLKNGLFRLVSMPVTLMGQCLKRA